MHVRRAVQALTGHAYRNGSRWEDALKAASHSQFDLFSCSRSNGTWITQSGKETEYFTFVESELSLMT